MITASLMRRRSRMIVALLAIAIGATILSGLVTIYYDVPRQMGAEFRNYGANMIFAPVEEGFTDTALAEGIACIADEDLVGATPYRYETVRIHEQPLMAAGTEFESAKKTSPYWLVDGDWPSSGFELMIGNNIAQNLQIKPGETVSVRYEKESGDSEEVSNEVDFTVTGILSTGGSEEDYVYMALSDMEELTNEKGTLDLAELSVSGGSEKLNAYADKINSGSYGYDARLVKRVTASETTVLSKLQALVLLVTVIVLALTMICVATTMTAVVTERRREIGLRKAIGASDASIIKEFMGEGMMLGAVGGILGSFVGFLFAQAVSVNVFSSSISFRPLLVPITIIVSIAVTAIACLFPIKSATAVDPALVLKGE